MHILFVNISPYVCLAVDRVGIYTRRLCPTKNRKSKNKVAVVVSISYSFSSWHVLFCLWCVLSVFVNAHLRVLVISQRSKPRKIGYISSMDSAYAQVLSTCFLNFAFGGHKQYFSRMSANQWNNSFAFEGSHRNNDNNNNSNICSIFQFISFWSFSLLHARDSMQIMVIQLLNKQKVIDRFCVRGFNA